MTRAPYVRLTCRLMLSAHFFKTKPKLSRTLLRLKTIRLFFTLAKRLKITTAYLLTKTASGRDINKKTDRVLSQKSSPEQNMFSRFNSKFEHPQSNSLKYNFDSSNKSVPNWKFEDRIIEYFYCCRAWAILYIWVSSLSDQGDHFVNSTIILLTREPMGWVMLYVVAMYVRWSSHMHIA